MAYSNYREAATLSNLAYTRRLIEAGVALSTGQVLSGEALRNILTDDSNPGDVPVLEAETALIEVLI